jgi:hypothetical protein
MYRSKGAYPAEAEVLAQRLGSGTLKRGNMYHPHGNLSSHPHTQCPTGVVEGEPVMLSWSVVLPPCELARECEVVM